ncbi:MAG: 3-hydroxyacyl-CoA dehydrogenase family protein [Acetobacteraceae bacterium]|nr:3-hydroxyacyl-CoA dehydrogenase family protein [Acetobacteraceae bacterium]
MYVFKAAVIGAGTMGAEIAQVISWSGLPVVLKDIDRTLLDRGMAQARSIYQRRVDRGKMTPDEAEAKLALITPTLSYDELKDADFVIEAVPEKMELKKAVFAELDEACQSTAILASNTSALSISEMAAATRRPDRVVGVHFFFPASVMKLVEVIAGAKTSEETMDTAVEFVESLRKIPVRVKECPGFLVNRVLLAAMRQALVFHEETGETPQAIDAAIKEGGGVPMGPFTLADTLGLDIVLEVCRTLQAAYGPRFSATPSLERLVAEGKLGAKRGQGFYQYSG